MRTSTLPLTLLSTSAALSLAQTTTSAPPISVQTSIALLIGSSDLFAASIVDANVCDTTVALACTDTEACAGAPTITVTQGPFNYIASYATSANGAAGSFSESCSLEGPSLSVTQAVCKQSASLSAAGTSSTVDITTTLVGSQITFQQVPVTAGAEKLATATGTCTSSQGAAPTVAMGFREAVVKVVVPIGAAAVLAMV